MLRSIIARGRVRSRSVRDEGVNPSTSYTLPGTFRTRVRTAGILAICFFFFWTHPVGALDVDEFEKRVREWLDLRQEFSQVKNKGKQQQGLLSDEMQMLEQQKGQLSKAVEVKRSQVNNLETKLGDAQLEMDAHTTSLERLTPSLLKAESLLKPWQQMLPFFMLPPLRETLKKLPEPEDPENPSRLAQRLRTVIGLYSQLEQLNCSVHAEKLIIKDPDGKEQEMDVVFFGLALGFAVFGQHS
ncbi:MAG: DUF3450 family protein [Planctomycetota bacterium]